MPSNAPIVINDGQATPVAHTFTPVYIGGNTMSWVDKSGPFPAAYNRITVRFTPPQNGSKLYKIGYKVEVPTGSVTSGIATLNDVAKFDGTFLFPEMGTLQSRKDARAFAVNGLIDTLIKTMVESPEFVY